MIRANHITKTFDGFKALDDATLHVKKGSVYGLVGPNGAGKSTIIRHLTGIYRPDAGEVLIDGAPVLDNPVAKAKFAYIPDDFFYYLQATTKDMKKFYQGLYPNFNSQLFDQLQEYFPTINVNRTIRHLSKGMQKQVAFWLSVCTMPEILILDEPVDGLDPVMRRQIWSIVLSEVADKETTVLVSSHNLRELEDVCDHVGIMHKGKVMIERSLSELQGSICKLQVAFAEDDVALPAQMHVLHKIQTGRVQTLIVRGEAEVAKQMLVSLQPLLIDVLPLSLEEIFIYEMGGVNYDVKDILF